MPSKGDKTELFVSIQKFWLGLVVVLLISLFLQALPSSHAQYEANDTVIINVTVRKVAMVSIDPDKLSWVDVPPGGVGDGSNEETGNYTGVWIENIGSANISYVWLNSTYPSSRPFGTGNPLAYDAGNFVVVTPNESTIPFHFVNRVEYPDPDTMYVKVNRNPPDFFGRFRNSSYEYFFELVADVPGNCTNGTLYFGDTPKTQYSSGDIDLTDNAGIVIKAVGIGGKTWGVGEVNVSTEERYCVMFDDQCRYVIFNRWNKDLFGNTDMSTYCPDVDGYLVNAASQPLYPGQVLKASIRVFVPYGVAHGTVKPGVLTVFVQE